MNMKARLLLASAAIAGLAGLVWTWHAHFRYVDAPEVSFTMLDGSRPAMSDLVGNPVLVTFWGTSCVECIREMPDLVRMHDEYSSQGLRIIGVAMPYEPPHLVYQFQQMRKLPYQLSLDLDGSLSRGFGDVRLTPTTLLVSPGGEIVYHKTGPFDTEWLRSRIASMLERSA